ncbi:MAG: hypothetical protein ACI4R9_09295 [Kiritimatiellia bacterium]
MRLFKQCIVCDRKFIGMINKNHYDLYHDALLALKKGTPFARGFVCEDCAHAAATVKCSVCGKNKDDIFYHVSRGDVSGGLSQYLREYHLRAQKLLNDIGSSFRISAKSVFVCDDCLIQAFNQARSTAIEKVGQPDDTKQTLWLNYGLVTDSKCCCRCGNEIRENYAKLFHAFVDFFFVPIHENDRSGYSVWEGAHGYLCDPNGEGRKEFFRKQLEECYFYDNCSSLGVRREHEHWYTQFRKVVQPFLKEKVLCRNCCAYLMSDKFRQDYFRRSERKWLGFGCQKDDSMLGFSKQIIFDKVALEQMSGADALRILKSEAWEMGANGIVNLTRTNNGYEVRLEPDWYLTSKLYDWSGVPVFWRKEGSIGKIYGKVIVDGSNIVFADKSKLTTGLSTCLKGLKLRKLKSFVFLDANIYHKLEELENGSKYVKELKGLIENAKGSIAIVPAGTRADDFILKKADTDGCHVLSNDRYKPYTERYPWIKQDRVHRFSFVDGRLMIPDFDIDIENK